MMRQISQLNRHLPDEGRRQFFKRCISIKNISMVYRRCITQKLFEGLGFTLKDEALETADTDMTVAQPHQHRRARW